MYKFGLSDIVETVVDYGTFEVGMNVLCIIILLKVYDGQGMECDSLNIIDPHKLKWSGIIRRYGFVRVKMTLVKNLCH